MAADTMKFEQKPSTPEIFRKAASFTSQLHVSIPFGEQEKEEVFKSGSELNKIRNANHTLKQAI